MVSAVTGKADVDEDVSLVIAVLLNAFVLFSVLQWLLIMVLASIELMPKSKGLFWLARHGCCLKDETGIIESAR